MNLYNKPYSIILDRRLHQNMLSLIESKPKVIISISNEIMKIKRPNNPIYACLQFDEIQYKLLPTDVELDAFALISN